MPRVLADARRVARGRGPRRHASGATAGGRPLARHRAALTAHGADRRAPLPATRDSAAFSFTLPQLVAAGLALMVMSGGGVWVLQHGGRATSMPPVAAIAPAESGRRRGTGRARRSALRRGDRRSPAGARGGPPAISIPRTIKILETNLRGDRRGDRPVAAARWPTIPANVYLNNHLADARQRKLALLRRATALVGGKTLDAADRNRARADARAGGAAPRRRRRRPTKRSPCSAAAGSSVNNFAGEVIIRTWDKDAIRSSRATSRARRSASGLAAAASRSTSSGNMGGPDRSTTTSRRRRGCRSASKAPTTS